MEILKLPTVLGVSETDVQTTASTTPVAPGEQELQASVSATYAIDRSSMAHGVEVRVPFLDHELVEFTAQIPEHLKLRGWQDKYILRRALRGVLPPEILYRRKRGLQTPYQQWLRDPLPAFAEDLLSTDRLRDKGYFVPSVVHTMLRQHREARSAWHGSLLMAVLAIQTWDELFLQARGPY